jgi:hypothetical protein
MDNYIVANHAMRYNPEIYSPILPTNYVSPLSQILMTICDKLSHLHYGFRHIPYLWKYSFNHLAAGWPAWASLTDKAGRLVKVAKRVPTNWLKLHHTQFRYYLTQFGYMTKPAPFNGGLPVWRSLGKQTTAYHITTTSSCCPYPIESDGICPTVGDTDGANVLACVVVRHQPSLSQSPKAERVGPSLRGGLFLNNRRGEPCR